MKLIYAIMIITFVSGCGKSDSTPAPVVPTTENFDLKNVFIGDPGNVTFVPVSGANVSLLKVTNGSIDLNKSGSASAIIKVNSVSVDKQIFELQFVPDVTFQTINGSATKNFKSISTTTIVYVTNFPMSDTNAVKSDALNLLNSLPGAKKYNPN